MLHHLSHASKSLTTHVFVIYGTCNLYYRSNNVKLIIMSKNVFLEDRNEVQYWVLYPNNVKMVLHVQSK